MDLERLLKPKRVAVVGVSTSKENHPANVIFKKLMLRYPVEVHGVNPRGGEVQGWPLYESLSSLPVVPDMVIIATQASLVPKIMEECIRLKAGGALVMGGGFAEIGNTDLQNRILSIAEEADFPFLGPNCLGIFAPGRIDTLFLPGERMQQPPQGGVAIVSQSGALLVDLLVKFANRGIGVSQGISIGNKAMIREISLLNYLAADPDTYVIVFYVEGFSENEGAKFIAAARQCKKPVVVMKSGKSEEGTRAVSSHTASIAGDYRVFSEVLAQHGIVEAKNENELLAYSEVLSVYPRNIRGNVGIITISGGHGAVATDFLAARGMSVPQISPEVHKRIKNRLSPSVKDIAILNNPVDLTGSAVDEDFIVSYDEMTHAPEFDALLMLVLPYSPGLSVDLGAKVSNPSRKRVKPLVAYIPHVEKYQIFIEGFELNRVPVSDSIEGAVMMLDGMRRYRSWF
ncbi:MAG: CoA-binding protein [Desulfatitalea sp.]|nr:CoA-binding protein [Desulfatitalea sp.]NNJ99245.1 CoA-binding protein [Desulfatitalea sp.]